MKHKFHNNQSDIPAGSHGQHGGKMRYGAWTFAWAHLFQMPERLYRRSDRGGYGEAARGIERPVLLGRVGRDSLVI